MNFLNQLPSNPWAWLILAIITIGGFVLAYRSTPQKQLKYSRSSIELITNRQSVFEKLDIRYDGKPVNSLSVTKITLWNNSFPTINNTDIVEAAPILITAERGTILNTSVLAGEKTSNCVAVTQVSNNEVKISFDYLDRKEGGIIQVVHTGGEHDIQVDGKIKGGKILFANYRADYKIVRSSGFALILLIMMLVYWETPLISEIWHTVDENGKTVMNNEGIIFFIVFFVLYAGKMFWIMVKEETGYIPKNCKKGSK